MLLQFIIYGLINGAILMLVALSFDMVYSSTRIFNMAHAGVYTVSSYMLLTFFTNLGWDLHLSVPIAIVISVFLNIMLEVFFFYPLEKKKLKGGVFIITSIGIYTIIINLIALFYGNETKIVLSGLQPIHKFGEIIITRIQFYQFFAPVAIVIILLLILKFTDLGRDIKALSNNPLLLSVLGASIRMIRIVIFSISAILVSIASMLVSLDVGMDPYVGIPILLNSVVAVIIGGKNNFAGIIAGSFMLTLIQCLVIYKFPSRWEPMVTFIILILVLIFKPDGLFSRKKRVETKENG